jgi:HAD superfamily hydrolase (TIGR01509 family)
MPIKGIFWDNDGVLVDTEHLYFRATAETLHAAGIALSRESFIEISLRQGESVLCLARRKGFSAQQVEDLRQARNERYAGLLRQGVKAIAGVERILRLLHGRVRMAIVTSSLRDHFDLIHHSTGLTGYFDFVLTREDYTFSKPHPEPYLTALKRSGLDPGECIVIEDSERGLQAAVEAGLRCLIIPGELTRGGDFSAAWRTLHDVHEIPSAISDF